MPLICEGCGFIANEPEILYYCLIFHKWLCHDCFANLPGPKAWAEKLEAK